MTLRKLTAAVAFTVAAGLVLPAVASANDRYDRGRDNRGGYDRGNGSYNRGNGSYNRGYGSSNRGYYNHGHRYYRPYRSYRPAPGYYYDPYVYGGYYGYAPAPYYRYDSGPGIHLHLDF
jgi:hypothetical protein